MRLNQRLAENQMKYAYESNYLKKILGLLFGTSMVVNVIDFNLQEDMNKEILECQFEVRFTSGIT